MKVVKAGRATFPHQKSRLYSSIYLAAFFVATAVALLFAFEDYPGIIESYEIAWMTDVSVVVAAMVALASVLAVPALLYMSLSSLMRLVSRVCSWLVLWYWLVIGLWQNFSGTEIPNAGLFGVHVPVPQGWWLVTYVMILMILLAYVVLGGKQHDRAKGQ